MATPKATTVRRAFQTLLEGITGTYATGSGKVVWVPLSDVLPGQLFNTGHRTVIGLAVDVETDNPDHGAMGTPCMDLPITVIAATRYEHTDDPYTPPAKNREDTQDELKQAVLNRIDGDLHLGGEVIGISVPDTDQSYENTGVQGWAVVLLQAILTYQRTRGVS
jgi:hypothetical protein